MPLLDASTPARVGPTVAASITTAAFNPPANSIVVICPSMDIPSTTATTITLSNNGTALTWIQVVRQANSEAGSSAGTGDVSIWYAVVNTAITGLTVTVASSVTGRNLTMKPYVLTSVDPADRVGNIGEGSFTTAVAQITTSAVLQESANSMLFVVANESDSGSENPTCANTIISPYVSVGNMCGLSGYRDGGAAGTSQQFTIVKPTGTGRWNWVVAEFEDSPAAPVLRPPRKPNRTHPKFRR